MCGNTIDGPKRVFGSLGPEPLPTLDHPNLMAG